MLYFLVYGNLEKYQNHEGKKENDELLSTTISTIDLDKAISITGKCDHKYKINYGKREVVCEKCGYGFNFLVHEVEEKEKGKLFHKKLNRYVT